MHITITGRLGSGKSTVAKIIVAEHGYKAFLATPLQIKN